MGEALITDGEILTQPGIPKGLTLYKTNGQFYLWDGQRYVTIPNRSVKTVAEGVRILRCAERYARGENPYGPEMQALADEAIYHDAGRAAVCDAYRKHLGGR